MIKLRHTVLAAALGVSATATVAANWSDTEVQLLHGTDFQEPFNDRDVTKTILTLTHASGHDYGGNFFFVDFIKSDRADNSEQEVYGEWYTSLSLSKLSGKTIGGGPLKDVSATFGINAGSKTNGARPRVFLPGVTLHLDVPGFAFFNVDVLAYMDRGKFNGADNCGEGKNTYQITPAWLLPFQIGQAKFQFTGFIDFIGAHGNCKAQILTQPQLRLDVGNFFGKPDTMYAGIEYQYWKNKYGGSKNGPSIANKKDNFAQLLLTWKF